MHKLCYWRIENTVTTNPLYTTRNISRRNLRTPDVWKSLNTPFHVLVCPKLFKKYYR